MEYSILTMSGVRKYEKEMQSIKATADANIVYFNFKLARFKILTAVEVNKPKPKQNIGEREISRNKGNSELS